MPDINRDTNRLTAAAAIVAAWMSAGGSTAAAQSEPNVVYLNGKTMIGSSASETKYVEKRILLKAELDAAAPDHPGVSFNGMHELVASSLAPAPMGAEKGTVTLAHGGVRHTTIPESFWGRWAPGTEVCKNADKSVIVLSATTYVSSQANCTVDWVAETAGAGGPIYSAHIQCSNRAGKAQRTTSNLIILPKDANQISVGSEFGNLKLYQRCSPNEPATTQ
jgi:hypothetical protein